MSKKKIVEYDILRVIATILVIIGHSNYIKIATDYGGIYYSDHLEEAGFSLSAAYCMIGKLVPIIYSFHMPLFLALSGAVFALQLEKNKITSVSALAANKFRRLMIPFFAVGILFSIPIKLISGFFETSDNVLRDIFVGQILIQGNTYLWYLPTLFSLFIIIYTVESRLKGKELIKLAVYMVLNLASAYVGIMLIKHIMCYLLWFYAGMLFHQNKQKLDRHCGIVGAAAAVVGFMVTFVIMSKVKSSGHTMWSELLLNVTKWFPVVFGSASIYMLSRFLCKTRLTENKFYKALSMHSYGLYLYSDPLNYLFIYIGFSIWGNELFTDNVLSTALFLFRVIGSLILALVISMAVNKIGSAIAGNKRRDS